MLVVFDAFVMDNGVYIACRFSLPYKHLLPGEEGGAEAM